MDGIILINKQKGCTSHDIVYKAKKILGEKVGHTRNFRPDGNRSVAIINR